MRSKVYVAYKSIPLLFLVPHTSSIIRRQRDKISFCFLPLFVKPLSPPLRSSPVLLVHTHAPLNWITLFVTPIPKTPSPQSLNDLRSVAITPIPSLICEDFVFNWAYDKLSNSLDIQQFGNLRVTSTSY
ncbi:hypothetical protein E2C01_040991 [Portunus trituberculatus]|uniref:Uncharacterized protein n=1 Tax=Portunus trituberculatus TaxID=210409 RepID=A0A5B7FI10_PORTR|nr:hypothetical protein [Portunus trituberculatus]